MPVAKVAFDPAQAPADWNYERDGKPDIVFMIFNPTSILKGKKLAECKPIIPKPLLSFLTPAEEAVKIQKSMVVK